MRLRFAARVLLCMHVFIPIIFIVSGCKNRSSNSAALREFDYRLTINGELLVRSIKSGQQAATLSGLFIPENQRSTLSNSLVVQSEPVRKILDTNGRNTLVDTTTEIILAFPVNSYGRTPKRAFSVFTPKDTNRPKFLEHPGYKVTIAEQNCDGDLRSFAASKSTARSARPPG